MPTDTYNSPGGSSNTWTSPAEQTVTILLKGPGGGDVGSYPHTGGNGGKIRVEYQVDEGETIDFYVGGSGSDGNNGGGGGSGYYSGGSGGSDAAGGGGCTAAVDSSGNVIASAGGGGGAGSHSGVYNPGSGGGGGARGGGSSSGGSNGGGSGAGGAGGQADGNGDPKGGDGGYVHNQGTFLNGGSGTGPSSTNNGSVEIEYVEQTASTPSNVSASIDNNDNVNISWDKDSANSGYYVYRSNSSGSSKSDYSQIATVTGQTWESGFEDMSPWTVNIGSQTSNRVYEGNNSFYCGNNSSSSTLASWTPFSSGKKVNSFSYYYQETNNSHGQGVKLKNSNGDVEIGTATDNPQFVVDGSSGISSSSGGNYDTWVKVTHEFDWGNNQVTISFEALDNSASHTTTEGLKQGLNISKVELCNYNSNSWNSGSNMDSWWDGFSFLKKVSKYTDTTATGTKYYRVSGFSGELESNLSNEVSATILSSPTSASASRVSDSEIEIDWNEASSGAGYKIYRSQSSGSSLSDYTEVADVSSSPFTDSGLTNGESYYYRITSYS